MATALDSWEHVPSKMDHFSFIDARAFLVKNLFHQVRHSCVKLTCNYHCMRNSFYSRRSIMVFVSDVMKNRPHAEDISKRYMELIYAQQTQGKQDEGKQVLRKLQEDVVADSRRPYAEKARWSAIDRIISVGLKAESVEMCHMVMQHLRVKTSITTLLTCLPGVH